LKNIAIVIESSLVRKVHRTSISIYVSSVHKHKYTYIYTLISVEIRTSTVTMLTSTGSYVTVFIHTKFNAYYVKKQVKIVSRSGC